MIVFNGTKHDMDFSKKVRSKEEAIACLKAEKERKNIIVVEQGLGGEMEEREFILRLRVQHPETRIIYILKYKSNRKLVFLYKWLVFDILVDGVNIVRDIKNSIEHPKSYSDIQKTYHVSWNQEPSETMLKRYHFLEMANNFKEKYVHNGDICYGFEYKIDDLFYKGVIKIPYGDDAYMEPVRKEFRLAGDNGFPYQTSQSEDFDTLVKKCEELFRKDNRLKRIINNVPDS